MESSAAEISTWASSSSKTNGLPVLRGAPARIRGVRTSGSKLSSAPREGKDGLSVPRGGRAGLLAPPLLPRRIGTPAGCRGLASLGCAVGGVGCGTVLTPLLPRRTGTPVGCRIGGCDAPSDGDGGATTPPRPMPRLPGTGALSMGWRGPPCVGGAGRRGSSSSSSSSLRSGPASMERLRITAATRTRRKAASTTDQRTLRMLIGTNERQRQRPHHPAFPLTGPETPPS